MRDMLYKQFQKAPENRESNCSKFHFAKINCWCFFRYAAFNQAKIAYNATKDEKVEAYKKIMESREAKFSRA